MSYPEYTVWFRGKPACPEETWRPVVGYEETHEVSDQGRVRRLGRMVWHYPSQAHRFSPERLLKLNLSGPYPRVGLNVDGTQRVVAVHRLVAAAFLGPRPAGMQVCHTNGDPTDNRLTNLRYDTSSANNYDQVRHGTHSNARKTHCPQGHPYDDENTLWAGQVRRCRICRTESLRRAKARYRANRGAA